MQFENIYTPPIVCDNSAIKHTASAFALQWKLMFDFNIKLYV